MLMPVNPIRPRKHLRPILFFLAALVLAYQPLFAQGGGTRTITDMAGRQVVIEGPVNRVITTFKPASICMFSLGLAHKLVGVDNSSRKDRLHLALLPEIAHMTGVGTKTMGISFESVVSLRPDLVILFAQKDGLTAAERLAVLNIPSIIILPETFDTIKQALRIIAEAVGEKQKCDDVENLMDDIMSFTARRLAGLADHERKTGYFASSLGLFSTTTGNMLQNDIFDRAGIRNVSAHLTGYFQDISQEQLVKWNPDIMVLSQHLKKSEAGRLSDRPLQTVTAVANRAVYRCPSTIAPWDFPSPLSVLACLWVARKAYPERFADVDLNTRVDDFHQHLFGRTMTQMGGFLGDTID